MVQGMKGMETLSVGGATWEIRYQGYYDPVSFTVKYLPALESGSIPVVNLEGLRELEMLVRLIRRKIDPEFHTLDLLGGPG